MSGCSFAPCYWATTCLISLHHDRQFSLYNGCHRFCCFILWLFITNNVQTRFSVISFNIHHSSFILEHNLFNRRERGSLKHYAAFLQITHLVADTERHLRNLDVDEGVVHGGSLLHLVDVVHGMLEEAGGTTCLQLSRSVNAVWAKPIAESSLTSGAFLNDLLTPAVRFSPWVTPLLGPIAPMVSSDDCRGLTGIPETHGRYHESSVASERLGSLGLTLPSSLNDTLRSTHSSRS